MCVPTRSLLWLTVLVTVVVVGGTDERLLDWLPEHCHRVDVLSHDQHQLILNGTVTAVWTKLLNFEIVMGQTVCFAIPSPPPTDAETEQAHNDTTLDDDGQRRFSALISIAYRALEHSYPIRQHYRFGIPLLQSSCACSCTSMSRCPQTCSPVNCFRSVHRAPACDNHYASHVCCATTMTPYNQWTLDAVNIGPPVLTAVFENRLHHLTAGPDGRQVVSSASDTHHMSLSDALNSFADVDRSSPQSDTSSPSVQLSTSVTTYPNRLPSRWYFTFANETRLRSGAAINELHEYDVGKLGYFRQAPDGSWDLSRAALRLAMAHRVHVTDCQQQLYDEGFAAEQLVVESDVNGERRYTEMLYLGEQLTRWEPWIGSQHLTPDQRHLLIQHKTPNRLSVTIKLNDVPLPVSVAHVGRLDHFTARLGLDRHSNTYLNLTLVNGRGTLHGYMQPLPVHAASGRVGLAFEFVVANAVGQPSETTVKMDRFSYTTSSNGSGTQQQQMFVRLPARVRGRHKLCIWAQDAESTAKCAIVKWQSTDRQQISLPDVLVSSEGECPADVCAPPTESLSDRLRRLLNPTTWSQFAGDLQNANDAIHFCFQLVTLVFLALILVWLVRTFVYPLCKCALGGGSSGGCSGGGHKQQQPVLQVHVLGGGGGGGQDNVNVVTELNDE